MTGISRRNLLKGAAFSAAGVAALGLAGCAPQTEATKAEAGLAETGETAKHTWEVKPEPIAADQISQTVDTEVLVIGGGYSGSCCALSAAQNGAKTILVEKDAVLNGHGCLLYTSSGRGLPIAQSEASCLSGNLKGGAFARDCAAAPPFAAWALCILPTSAWLVASA